MFGDSARLARRRTRLLPPRRLDVETAMPFMIGLAYFVGFLLDPMGLEILVETFFPAFYVHDCVTKASSTASADAGARFPMASCVPPMSLLFPAPYNCGRSPRRTSCKLALFLASC